MLSGIVRHTALAVLLIEGVLAAQIPSSDSAQASDPVVHRTIVNRKTPHLEMQFRQLMLDEYVVAARSNNVRKVYPQARKIGRPLLECEGPHELESMSLNMPCTVYDAAAKKYRMWWYNVWHVPADQGYLLTPPCYAESTDGLVWKKPVLNQLDYKGQGTANNCIAGIGPGRFPMSVVRGHDDRLRLFWANSGDGTALLEDGIRIVDPQRINLHPVTNTPEGRQQNGSLVSDMLRVMYDPVLKRYLCTQRTWAPLSGSKVPAKWRRAVALYTSPDGIKWTNTGRLIQTDAAFDRHVEQLPHRRIHDIPAWSELHDMTVQRYEGLIICLYGLLYFYDEDGAKGREIAGSETEHFLGWSRDGLNWSRAEQRVPLIPMPHGSDDWGRHTIGSPFMTVHEKEIRVYFDVGRGHTNRTYKTPRPKQISMATLRRDGFAGYFADAEGGYIQTAPFISDGTLRLNIDATDGKAVVEVMKVIEDSEHRGPRHYEPIEGFTDSDAVPVTGDQIDTAIEWNSASWNQLKGQLVSLRIHLNNATLYSFHTGSDNQ